MRKGFFTQAEYDRMRRFYILALMSLLTTIRILKGLAVSN